MNYLFPFALIPQNSKIILYGAGEVGKDFYLQIHALGNYYNLRAWVDKSFDSYELNAPFDKVVNISNYEFDYVILAVSRNRVANEIKNTLLAMNVPEEKIVWSKHYFINHNMFPKNKMLVLKHLDFYMDLLDEYWSVEKFFSGGFGAEFYQSFEELGFTGKRKTGERISLYHIRDFLKKDDSVLDIGCNCGFLAMQIAPYVKKVIGYEIEPKFVDIAKKVSNFLNIKNVDFRADNFLLNKPNEKFNVIFCFAVHARLLSPSFTEMDFVSLIKELLQDDGYLFFESHTIKNDCELYRRLCNMFETEGMKICLHQNYKMDLDVEREIVILQKLK